MNLAASSSSRKASAAARLGLLSALLLSTTALAQPRGLPEFEVERLEFNASGTGSQVVSTGRLLPKDTNRLALIGHYEKAPLSPAIIDATSETGERDVVLVSHRTTAHLLFAHGISDNLEIGLQVPVILSQEQGDVTGSPFGNPRGGLALGTPIASLNFGILRQSGSMPLDLAAGVSMGYPLGSANALGRESSMKGLLRVMMGREADGLRTGFEVGASLRPRIEIGVGDNREAYNTLRMGATVASVGEGVNYEANVLMWVPFGRELFTAEALAGVRGKVSDDVEAFAMGGLGFGDTLGNPDFRLLMGLSYGGAPLRCVAGGKHAPAECPELDDDGDGVKNSEDACPTEGGKVDAKGCPLKDEDKDGIEDVADKCPSTFGVASAQGCPDQDGDGVQDAEDKCPALAGPADRQGCPDSDGDGLDDSADKCPSEPGPVSRQGCPEKDSDKDGILDEQDACPNEAGLAELKGCPAKDKDNDTVADHQDNCPNEAGPADNQGCPAAQKQLVVIKQDRIELKDKVYFDTGAATIQPRSFALLDQIAKVLVEHPELVKLTIEGHTDDRGPIDFNRALSQQRADSVAAYLAGKGVAKERMVSKGFGPDRPVQPNTTPEGRAANRRVDFLTGYAEDPQGAAAPQ